MNYVVCSGVTHVIDQPYRWGALAVRDRVASERNPYAPDSVERAQWDAGYRNEAAGEHCRFGVDVIAVHPRTERVFAEDPAVPRDGAGRVDVAWYAVHTAQAGGAQNVRDFMRQFAVTVVLQPASRNLNYAVRVNGVTVARLRSEEAAVGWVDRNRGVIAREARPHDEAEPPLACAA